MLDTIVTRHQIFDLTVGGKVLSSAVRSAANPDGFYGIDMIKFLLQEGAFYDDILRDVFQHFPSEDISLDLVNLVLDLSELRSNLHIVTENLPYSQLEPQCTTSKSMDHLRASMDHLHVLQLLLQRGATLVDFDGLIYGVLYAVYSYDFEMHAFLDKKKSRPILVLDILKLIARQGVRFDIFKKRDWKNMVGWNHGHRRPRSGSGRGFLLLIDWRHTGHDAFSLDGGIRRRKIEEQVMEMAITKPGKIERGLVKSGRRAMRCLKYTPAAQGGSMHFKNNFD